MKLPSWSARSRRASGYSSAVGTARSVPASRAVQYLKGRSSHKLLSEFGVLRKRYWGQHLWGRGYWVASSGNVTDEVLAEVYQESDSTRAGR